MRAWRDVVALGEGEDRFTCILRYRPSGVSGGGRDWRRCLGAVVSPSLVSESKSESPKGFMEAFRLDVEESLSMSSSSANGLLDGDLADVFRFSCCRSGFVSCC